MIDEAKFSAVLRDFPRTMLTDFSIPAILDHLVCRIVEILDVTGAGVTLIASEVAPRYVAASDQSALLFEQLQSELEQGPCLTAFTSGSVVAVTDVAHDPRYPLFGPAAAGHGLASVFTFPLRHDDGRLGALDLYRDTPGELSTAELEAAQTLADVAAVLLLHARARAEVERQAEAYRHDALHDPLTGLANRTLLHERFEHLSARTQRRDGLCAVLFADLDHFKRINDVYGHDVGDGVLVAVAGRWSSLIRPVDTLARVSGDEFVFLLEDLRSALDGESLARRIGRAMQQPFLVGGAELRLSASIGVAYSGPGEELTGQLVKDADTAMYEVKRRGGGGHGPVKLTPTERAGRQPLDQEMRADLGRDTVGVAYQPIVHLSDGRFHGAEALLRWLHPTDGPVPALAAISLAERSGLISEVGDHVLRQACRDHERWRRAEPSGGPGRDLALHINVSVRQLMAAGFVEQTLAILAATGMPPTALVLEITESAFIVDGDRAARLLQELRRAGAAIALDDFGTGYSSLSYLRRFPVDLLKIDQSFVADVGHDPAASEIVKAVIALATGLGLTVIAEGVETELQRDALSTMGCDLAQGFLFHPALPEHAFRQRLRSG